METINLIPVTMQQKLIKIFWSSFQLKGLQEQTSEILIGVLNNLGLNLQNIRGYSYGNGLNMRGHKAINPKFKFASLLHSMS